MTIGSIQADGAAFMAAWANAEIKDAPVASATGKIGNGMDEAIAALPIFYPGGVPAIPEPASPKIDPVAIHAELRATRTAIEALPPGDRRIPGLEERRRALDGLDSVLQHGFQPTAGAVKSLNELRASSPLPTSLPSAHSASRPTVPSSSTAANVCHGPPLARPGNAEKVADAGIALGSSLQHGEFIASAGDLARYIDEYSAYTGTRAREGGLVGARYAALHADAVANGPRLLADRLDRDDQERELCAMKQLTADRLHGLAIRPPLAVQQVAVNAEIGTPIARVADFVVRFIPVAGQAALAVEAVTGREMFGLGAPVEDNQRVLDAVFAVLPAAAKLASVASKALVGGVREVVALSRLAEATGKAALDVRMVLVSAMDLNQERALLESAASALETGAALSQDQQAAIGRARVILSEFGGVTSGQARAVLERASVNAAYAAKIDRASQAYAAAVQSNKVWTWRTAIPGGAGLSEAEKRAIKLRTVELGLILEVPLKPGTRFPDFTSVGAIKRLDQLPEDLWLKSDAVQFGWLDARIPGGRPEGFTWHHTESPGRMELVPFGLHNITDHLGGRSEGQWARGPR
jgi:A nuclease of the HNH/ENDO VII superfamily with conserved WHH